MMTKRKLMIVHISEKQVPKPGDPINIIDLVNPQIEEQMIEHLGSEFRLISHTAEFYGGGLLVTILAEADERL